MAPGYMVTPQCTVCERAHGMAFVYSLQLACATLEFVFLLRLRQMKAPAVISLERSTPWQKVKGNLGGNSHCTQ